MYGEYESYQDAEADIESDGELDYYIIEKKLSSSPIHKFGAESFEAEYRILDNGGEPFLVKVSKNNVEIYQEVMDLDGNWNYTKLIKKYKPLKTFIGKSLLNPTTEFSGGYGKEFDGNSILLKIGKDRYVHIGSTIYEFSTDGDEIVKYYSPVGNSHVPYPFAYGKKNVYLMLGGDDEGRYFSYENAPNLQIEKPTDLDWEHYFGLDEKYYKNMKNVKSIWSWEDRKGREDEAYDSILGAESFHADSMDEAYYNWSQPCDVCDGGTLTQEGDENDLWVVISCDSCEFSQDIKMKEAESFEAEKKNCGCGQDPCVTYGAEIMGSVGDIENHSVDKYKTKHFLTDKELSDFLIKHGTNHDSIRKNKKAKGNIIISTPEGGWISEAKFSLSQPDNENDKDMLMIIPDDYLGIHQDAESFEAEDTNDETVYIISGMEGNIIGTKKQLIKFTNNVKTITGLDDVLTKKGVKLLLDSGMNILDIIRLKKSGFIREVKKISPDYTKSDTFKEENPWFSADMWPTIKILNDLKKPITIFDEISYRAESFEAEKIPMPKLVGWEESEEEGGHYGAFGRPYITVQHTFIGPRGGKKIEEVTYEAIAKYTKTIKRAESFEAEKKNRVCFTCSRVTPDWVTIDEGYECMDCVFGKKYDEDRLRILGKGFNE